MSKERQKRYRENQKALRVAESVTDGSVTPDKALRWKALMPNVTPEFLLWMIEYLPEPVEYYEAYPHLLNRDGIRVSVMTGSWPPGISEPHPPARPFIPLRARA